MAYPSRRAWAFAGLTLLGLGGLLVAVRARGHSDPVELAAETRLALQDRRWSRAEALLSQLARRRPPSATDVVLRAELERGRGRADEALRLLAEIPATDPLAGQARLVAGQIEKSRDRARRMEAFLREAVRLDPKLASARRELIRLYALQARRAELNDQYRALSALEPLHYEDVLLWTASLEDIWINETIHAQLERFLAADPDDRPSRLALAEVLLRFQRLPESETLLQPLPDSDPDARVLKARIALRRMQLDEFQSLLDGEPAEHGGLALLRAHFAVRMNDSATAARQFRIALRRDPANREALQGISLMLEHLGDREAASACRVQVVQRRHLAEILEKSRTADIRGDKALLTQLGVACEALGQIPEARAWYQLALVPDPLDASLQESLYRLRGRDP